MPPAQNIYDNEEFFEGYMALRGSELNANDTIIRPSMRDLVGDVRGLDVLDMGCGTGEMCLWMADSGAASVVGMDVSERMLEEAAKEPDERITYIHTAAEDASFEASSFDLAPVLRNIHTWLRPGGRFVFCMEHPIMTAGQGILEPGWVTDDESGLRAWTVLRYHDETERVSRWFVDGVVRYHRTMATIVNSLVAAGFRIKRMLEPHASEDLEGKWPKLLQERERPLFLFVSAEAES